MSTLMMDGAVHMGDLMNFHVDPDAAIVDPQLSLQYLSGYNEKQSEPMTIDPSMWQTPLDTSQRFDIVQPQGYQPEEVDEDEKDTTKSPPYETRARTAKATRTDSKSSVPSLSSGSSGTSESPPTKHTRSTTTKRQDSKPARKKQKTSKKAAVDDQEDEDDSKRNKYLERNRVAASKCRQKKKVWVSDLETQKTELERKHNNLQREYTGLVSEVTELKNQLMAHAGCGDPRIDGWIETEAKRFVERTADADKAGRRLSYGSAARRPSSSESIPQQPSPTMSSGAFSQSPVIKEEMNFDHMPDNMFE